MEDRLMAICSLDEDKSANVSSEAEAIIICIERTTKIGNILEAACDRWKHLTPSVLVVKYFASHRTAGRRAITLMKDVDVVDMYDLHKCLKAYVIDMLVTSKNMEGGARATTSFRKLSESHNVKPVHNHAKENLSLKRARGEEDSKILEARTGLKVMKYSLRDSSHDDILGGAKVQTSHINYRENQNSGKEIKIEKSEEILDTRSWHKVTGGTPESSSYDGIPRKIPVRTHGVSRENKSSGKINQRSRSRCRKRISRSNLPSAYPNNRQSKPSKAVGTVEGSKHQAEQQSNKKHILEKLNQNIVMSTKTILTDEELQKLLKLDKVFPSDAPCFIIIMRPTMISGRHFMTVPSKFREHLSSRRCPISLRVPGCKTKWKVKFVGRGFSYSCWKAFVHDNNLEEGDICVFELISKQIEIVMKVTIIHAVDNNSKRKVSQKREKFKGHEEFVVVRSLCEVSGHGSASTSHDDISQELHFPNNISRENQDAENGNHRIGSSSKKASPRRNQVSAYPENMRDEKKGSTNQHEQESVDENKFKALDHPNIFKPRHLELKDEDKMKLLKLLPAVRLENPCFISVIRHCMLVGWKFMSVPTAFRGTRLPAQSCPIEFQVQGCERKWAINLYINKRLGGFSGQGWNCFARENNLQEGDICLFELVKPTEFSFIVHIGRAGEGHLTDIITGF